MSFILPPSTIGVLPKGASQAGLVRMPERRVGADWHHGLARPSLTASSVTFRSVLAKPDVAVSHPEAAPAIPLRAHAARCGFPALYSPARCDEPPGRRAPAKDEDDPLDPVHRRRAALAPPDVLSVASAPAAHAPPFPISPADAAAPTMRAAASLEDLIPTLVRRVAWSGDRQRGTVRLELGAGELAGATLLVHAEAGRVRVHMDVPAGVDAGQWQRRIRDRLASKGVPMDAVEVT
jgi:hypothetical protein